MSTVGSTSGTTDDSGSSRRPPTRRASVAAPPPVAICGWLRLKGGFFRSWKLHYFVLHRGELSAYTTAHFERQPYKHRVKVTIVEKSPKHDMGFIVTSASGVQLTIAATCERDYDKWFTAFRRLGQPKPRRVEEPRLPLPDEANVDLDVYLYVPTNVIPLTTTSTKMDEARAEIQTLQATGGEHVPTRSTLEDPNVEWRVSKPDYALLDLLFLHGKSYNHKPGSVEWMVQNLIKTWEMEVCHKSNVEQWTTVNPKLFQCQVNATAPLAADDVLRMGKYDAFLAGAPPGKSAYDAKRSTRDRANMTFGSAFPEGFAWEVLEVFSKPPRVSFSWRHWGYPKHAPGAKVTMVELFGFTILDLDSSMRICGMETFYKAEAFLDALNRQQLLKRPDDSRHRLSSITSRTSIFLAVDPMQASLHESPSAGSKCPFRSASSPTLSENRRSMSSSVLSAPCDSDESNAPQCPFAGKYLRTTSISSST
ncbi:hypothetical protein ACHHYP_02326 [Achlya hypogyna]|uniref:PH domain-containing protein n=1 Tax=Achlya hypogyna TaxID=1202772 RepID=A0A1V9Z6W5_ACHHY|nr:hypothetical protein ACHHYP_02326 [Achlya hypogyna]